MIQQVALKAVSTLGQGLAHAQLNADCPFTASACHWCSKGCATARSRNCSRMRRCSCVHVRLCVHGPGTGCPSTGSLSLKLVAVIRLQVSTDHPFHRAAGCLTSRILFRAHETANCRWKLVLQEQCQLLNGHYHKERLSMQIRKSAMLNQGMLSIFVVGLG